METKRQFAGLVFLVSVLCLALTAGVLAQTNSGDNKATATAAAKAEPQATAQTVASPPQVVPALPVPRLIKFSGVVKDASGAPRTGTVGVTFSIYAEQEGGSTLWMETHNVDLDAQGHYSVLLGSTQSEGMPLELFAAGEPRWLGVKVELPGEAEQARVLLVSVPYALKASDADTLGGKPATAFVLAEGTQGAPSSTTSGTGATGTSAVVGAISPQQVEGSGTPNQVAKFTTNGTTIGNSAIAEVNGNIGVGLVPPSNQLFVLAVPPNDPIALNMSNLLDQDMLINVTPQGAADKVGEIGPTTGTNLGLQVGGVEKVRITNNGNVWIGSKPSSAAADTQRLVIAVPSTDTIAMNMSNLVDEDLLVSVTPPGAATPLGIIGPSTPTNLGLQVGGLEKVRITNAGLVGIGTMTPGQMLTVAGIVQSTTGGFMFPDGTTQTSAATASGGTVTSVASGAGLTGGPITTSGTLSIATGGVTNTMLANPSLTVTAGSGLSGGGSVSLGGSTTLSLSPTISGTTGTFSGATSPVVWVTNTATGVIGQLGTNVTVGPYTFPAGVSGSSSAATGTIGVFGSSGSYTGVYGVGPTGVYGQSSTASGTGVSGYGNYGVLGSTSGAAGSVGVYGNGDFGVQGIGGTYGVSGSGATGIGVYGSSTAGGVGVEGSSIGAGSIGVIGTSPDVYGVLSDGNFAVAAGFSKSGMAVLPDDRAVLLYSVESPENWYEDFGSGQLHDGLATIELEPTFAQTVSPEAGYHVFVTPKGDCEGLYVTEETATGFQVRELRGGKSSVAFDYRIVAKQKGLESLRLEEVSTDHDAAEAMRQHRAERPSHVPKLPLPLPSGAPKAPPALAKPQAPPAAPAVATPKPPQN